ncbi:PUA-like domain-containing protein [Suillus subalutaceus]|uniref:PUA-like domain-containing protein n=1 Tax=Suillus subalutaceus TaxID=48586 RepID=UPI001B880C3F|nr:PUA-like domain-containing protein [Suillus subalutaceus]KAG1851590.1 PUA-like domain-containing protein [Suillus subalutaceus]
MKTTNSVSDEKMKEDSKEISSEKYRKGSESPARPVHHFGEYPGAPFGTTWKNRTECFNAGVHHNIEAGISGTEADGAFSIVVSGQYKDDKDDGDTILYTGSGGRKLGDRTRELTRDQQWSDFGNEALRRTSETGKHVRVIRGYELDSEFAPWKGFRYDGLYICKAAWKEKDRDGYYDICRYIMERVPDQPPLRRRSTTVGLYKPLPGSETVQPPAPVPVTGRQRIRQREQARINNMDTFLVKSSPPPVERLNAELACKSMLSGAPVSTTRKRKLAGNQREKVRGSYGIPRVKVRYHSDDDEVL